MTKQEENDYKYYINSLFNFMVKEGYTSKPCPKIILDESTPTDLFYPTGYFDMETQTIRIFTKKRWIKDVLRTVAHELIHHRQRIDGTLDNYEFKGSRIVDDDKLVKLEEEAYLYGNISFRRWTETQQNKKEK